MPKNSLILNGFGGGLNKEADDSDIISSGEGKDELTVSDYIFSDRRGKLIARKPLIQSLTGVYDFDNHALAGSWTEGTYTNAFTQKASQSGASQVTTGTGLKITCVVNGSGDVTSTTIVEGGSGYLVNDTIIFVDPGAGSSELTYTVQTLNGTAIGVTTDSDANDVTANDLLYHNSKIYQKKGTYSVAEDVSWSGRGEYQVLKPTDGQLNPTTAAVLKNGVDIGISNDSSGDIVLFRGREAAVLNGVDGEAILFDSSGKLGDSSSNLGGDRYLKGSVDANADGSYGWNQGHWYDFTNTEHAISIDNIHGGTTSGCYQTSLFAVAKNDAGTQRLVRIGEHVNTSTSTLAQTEMSATDVSEMDYFVFTRNGDTNVAGTALSDAGTPAGGDESPFLNFRIGNFEMTNNNYEDGAYGSTIPSLAGKSINVEIKMITLTNVEGVYVILHNYPSHVKQKYDYSGGADANVKVWKITSTMIEDLGGINLWHRITLPEETALYTGSNFSYGNIGICSVGVRMTDGATGNQDQEYMNLRELSFTGSQAFGWSEKIFQFHQTSINSKGLESLPYRYSNFYGPNSQFSGSDYPVKLIVNKCTGAELSKGKIYYEEIDSSGSSLGDKFLFCEWDGTKGVKKAGDDEFTAWDSNNQRTFTYDDPPVNSTYTLESGYPEGVETVNAIWETASVVGRQVYIGNVAKGVAELSIVKNDNGASYNTGRYTIEATASGNLVKLHYINHPTKDFLLEDKTIPWAGGASTNEERTLNNTSRAIEYSDLETHGFAVNQYISMDGWTNGANNGIFKITAIGDHGMNGTLAGGENEMTLKCQVPDTGAVSGSGVGVFQIYASDMEGNEDTFVFYSNSNAPNSASNITRDASNRINSSLNPNGVSPATTDLHVATAIADTFNNFSALGITATTSGSSSDAYVHFTMDDPGTYKNTGTTNKAGMIFTINTTQGNYGSGAWTLQSGAGTVTAANANASTSLTRSFENGTGTYGKYKNNQLTLTKVDGSAAGLVDETPSSGSTNIKLLGFDSDLETSDVYDTSLILKSAIGKKAGFPDNLFIDLELGGDAIVHMVSSADRLFIFSQTKLVIINVAQDIEFLEASMDHMGISNPRQVCKVGEGVSFINNSGVFFFDGQQVQDLRLGRMGDVALDGDNCAIGYDANRGILYTWFTATTLFFYSLQTQSWAGHSYLSSYTNLIPDTNVDNGKDGLSFYEKSGKIYYIGTDVVSGTHNVNKVQLETGRISIGNIAQNKKFYNVKVSVQNAKNLRLYWRTDEVETAWTEHASASDNGIWIAQGTSVSDTVECKLSRAKGKWLQIKIISASTDGATGAVSPTNMSIGDISIVYRGRLIK